MIDSYIKKVIQDEEEKNEKEKILYEKQLEVERYLREKQNKENKFKDKMSRIRAKQYFDKEQQKEELTKKHKDDSIEREKEKLQRLEEREQRMREEERRKERMQKERQRRLLEQIEGLRTEREVAESHRRQEVEKKLKILEDK
jgi:hypothetical protein